MQIGIANPHLWERNIRIEVDRAVEEQFKEERNREPVWGEPIEGEK